MTDVKPFTEDNVKECLQKLNELSENWNTNPNNTKGLDANWVCVKFPKSAGWRTAKSLGGKKDYHWGWILWSKSKQECGSNFAVEVMRIASEYGFLTRERQL